MIITNMVARGARGD